MLKLKDAITKITATKKEAKQLRAGGYGEFSAIAIFVIGIPMLILEFSMGHFTQRAGPNAFAHSHKRLEFLGWWGIILGFAAPLFSRQFLSQHYGKSPLNPVLQ